MKRATPLIAVALAALTFAACGDDDDTPDDSSATEITAAGDGATTAPGAEITASDDVTIPSAPGSVAMPENRDEAEQMIRDALTGMGVEVTDEQIGCVMDASEDSGFDSASPEAFEQMMSAFEDCGIDLQAAITGQGG
jgi:hypothetical protein